MIGQAKHPRQNDSCIRWEGIWSFLFYSFFLPVNMPVLVACDPASLRPYLYEALSIALYDLNPRLQMLLFRPGPMAPEYEHWDPTGHTVTDDQELVFIMPPGQLFELTKFAAIFHGAMRIAFRFM